MAPGTLAHGEGPLHYWRGEGPLWRLYWIYGVLVSTAGGTILMTAAIYRLLPPGRSSSSRSRASPTPPGSSSRSGAAPSTSRARASSASSARASAGSPAS
jgi:hypothetical protein